MQDNFTVVDTMDKETYSSGMVRNSRADKINFALLLPEGIPFEAQMLTRWATHLTKGAKVYAARNWEKAQGVEELEDFKESAFRHFMEWYCGLRDEDHASAVFFNITGYETTKYKIDNGRSSSSNVD